MKILVCGGRDYKNVSAVRHALTALHAKNPITLIIEGGAPGADRLAREWAEANNVPVQTFEADWKRFGRRAGPLRNKRMLDEGKPDGVVAFPGGTGTANMIDLANAYCVKVWQPFG
jgi:predicted Rossmann-fold nucleotide-binding protein